ncbi:MAG TPA: phosphatidylglycerophosphatase A [Candidatus Kapabacteria bacterium]|jgi:phosphatidylglycerophosphatase A
MSTAPRSQFDWLSKARSRLWSKRPQNLGKVPTLALLVGTFFYSGLSPVGSGTVGSIVAAAIYYFLHGLQDPIALAIACVVVLVLGIWSGGVVERVLEVQDPGIVVIDEVLGQWMALLTIQFAGNLSYIVVAFLFFRIFDVLKPWPARFFERMHGGTGIMLDDAVAGIYAWIAAHLIMMIF